MGTDKHKKTRDHKGANNPFFGRHHTPETKEKISKAQRCRNCLIRQVIKANQLRLENLRKANETATL